MQRRLERAAGALLLVAVIAFARPAGAGEQEPPTPPEASGTGGRGRAWAGEVGPGVTIALVGPARTGFSAVAALHPGAWAGFGMRVEARTMGDDDAFAAGLFTAGLAYAAAGARPHLSLALHADAGATAPHPRPAMGGGVEIELWIVGPAAIALDGSAHVLVDGLDSQLVLAGTLGLRLAR